MAFKIHGEVSLDGAMFKRGLHEISGETTAFLKNFALGAIGISSIEHAIDKTIESAKELVDTSRKMDLTVEQLQVIRQAAEDSGVEFGAMTSALQRFNAVRENILQGGKGSGKQMASMMALGVSREDLKNKTAAENMMGGISETAKKSNAADIANDLKQVFGRGGQEIFGALKTDFGELESKMKSMGAIMDATTANQLARFKDEMELVGRIIESSIAPILVLFGKGLFELVTVLGTIGTMLGTWIGSVAEYILHPEEIVKNPKKAFKDLFSMGSSGEAGDAAEEYWKDKQKEFDDIFNKKSEPIKPQSVAFEPPEEKQKKLRDYVSKGDALVSVGNFLGAGGRDINNLARQQLEIATEQRDLLKEISDKMDTQGEGSVDYSP